MYRLSYEALYRVKIGEDKSFNTKEELLEELSRHLSVPIEEAQYFRVSHLPETDHTKEVIERFKSIGVIIKDTVGGYNLHRQNYPPFEVFTTEGTLMEKFLCTGDQPASKRIKWGGFIPTIDQRKLNQWRSLRKHLRNPGVQYLGYSYLGLE